MKVFLLIIGIVCITGCVLSFLMSAFSQYSYKHVLDGSAELYARLHRRAVIFLISGIALTILGAACLVIRVKM
ncbi:MAG: hypothetical protein IJM24_09685 [Clostridia bacterium]|nr:hypothetical protein [Clostridia bacterium]